MEAVGTISDILQHKGTAICSITPDATVFDAIHLMSDRNIGALLVMQGSRLLGTISERDYTRKVVLKGKASRETAVGEIMQPPVPARPESTVVECMRLMTEHRIRHLPILEDNRVVGIVSIGDLVNWIISEQNATISHLESYISGQYPG
jgi:CBS domain-containing protein